MTGALERGARSYIRFLLLPLRLEVHGLNLL